MLTIKTEILVGGITGEDIARFMLHCTNADYQEWWPGTHIAFHTITRMPGDLGNLVYFDEYIGRRRLKFKAIVTEVLPGKRIVWQMQKIVMLPAWLCLDLENTREGVRIIHTLTMGFSGVGKTLDPLIGLYLSKGFESDMDQHARTEFMKLKDFYQIWQQSEKV